MILIRINPKYNNFLAIPEDRFKIMQDKSLGRDMANPDKRLPRTLSTVLVKTNLSSRSRSRCYDTRFGRIFREWKWRKWSTEWAQRERSGGTSRPRSCPNSSWNLNRLIIISSTFHSIILPHIITIPLRSMLNLLSFLFQQPAVAGWPERRDSILDVISMSCVFIFILFV